MKEYSREKFKILKNISFSIYPISKVNGEKHKENKKNNRNMYSESETVTFTEIWCTGRYRKIHIYQGFILYL